LDLAAASIGAVSFSYKPLAGMEFLQNRDFELAQFAIGDDEKISAAAGRIEKGGRR
jgi:hypothetical protein